MDPAHQVASRTGWYAALICASVLLVVVAVVRFVPPDPAYLRATFTIEHVEFLGMFDNRGQQWAHRVAVGMLAVLAIAVWLARPKPLAAAAPPLVGTALRYAGIVLIVTYVLLLLLEGRARTGDTAVFHGRYSLFPALSLRTQLLLAGCGMACLYFWARLPALHDRARTLGGALALLWVAALVVVGTVREPSFQGFTPGLVAGVEWHYSGAISSADRLAAGEQLGTVPIHSSLLGSVLLGSWQRAAGMLDFGGHIQLLASLQSAMLILAALACGAWYGWRSGAWVIALLLALPWMQPLQAAVLYPNQSSWRFLGLCAGVVLLAFTQARRVTPLAAALGAGGGFALLWNAETGVVLNGAYFVFLFLRRARGTAAVAYLAGLAASLVAFCLVTRLGLGYWPDPVAVARSFPLIGNFSKGYGGLGFSGVDALALLVFAHSLYLVARGILEWAVGSAFPPRAAARMALAALLVAWAAYYFKAPHPWNLWTALFIYSFLLGDLLFRPTADNATVLRLAALPRAVLLGMVVLPAIFATNAMALFSIARTLRQPPCPAASVVSGICLPDDLAALERAKAAALKKEAAAQPILYFTADSYLMPLLTGVYQPLRYRDAFSDVVFASDFDELLADVRKADPACILYDDPASILSGYDAHRAFYRRLRSALAGTYELRATTEGWEIHCRKAAATAAS